jgi:hypothetical protein
MRYGIVGALVAAAFYTLVPPHHLHRSGAGLLRQGTSWSWHGRLAAGKAIEIRGVSGSISAQAASGNEVEVTAEKHGRRSDPDDVTIEVVEHDGGVTICAVYPGRNNRCAPGGGQMNTRNNDVEVEFTVHVPRDVGFVGATVNGGVEAVGLSGPVEASTVNDGIHIETSAGDVRASTVNGSITAVATGAGTRPLRFNTVNGSITVTLPRNLSADVEAATVNGTITTDFPITVDGRMSPRRLRGRIGQGGRSLELETVNGSIRIRSAM